MSQGTVKVSLSSFTHRMHIPVLLYKCCDAKEWLHDSPIQAAFLNGKQEFYPVCFWLTLFNFHRNPPMRFWHPEMETAWFWAKKWSFPFGNTHRYCFAILMQTKLDLPRSWLLVPNSFLLYFSQEQPKTLCLNTSSSFCNPCPLLSWCSSDHKARSCHSPHAHAGPTGEPGQHLEGRGDRPIPEKAAWFNKWK